MSEFSVRPDWMAFCLPDISEAEVQADADVIRSGWWAKGPRTMEFQKKFAEYVGAKHCIAVNSCTAALHLALLTQEIGPGDEVITTPLTFASTANTILHVGGEREVDDEPGGKGEVAAQTCAVGGGHAGARGLGVKGNKDRARGLDLRTEGFGRVVADGVPARGQLAHAFLVVTRIFAEG